MCCVCVDCIASDFSVVKLTVWPNRSPMELDTRALNTAANQPERRAVH